MKIISKIILAALFSTAAFAGTCPASLTATVTPLNIGVFDSNHLPGYYLQVKVTNTSRFQASAIEVSRTYTETGLADAAPANTIKLQMIKEGNTATAMFNNDLVNDQPVDSRVWVHRVIFSNGTVWQDDGTRACSIRTGSPQSVARYASR